MLQQTQVDRVVPRYERWLERWPTVEALAAATTAEVILEWQGLGYNRRAVSLHRAARAVAERGWPDDLTELPGVGPYTAAAVGNFAFGRDVLPVDTNVRRVQERTGRELRRRRARRRCSTSARPSASRACRAAACARSRSAARRAAGATSRCASSRRSRARSGSAAPIALRAVAAGRQPADDGGGRVARARRARHARERRRRRCRPSAQLEQSHGLRGEALAAAGEAEPVGRRRADVDLALADGLAPGGGASRRGAPRCAAPRRSARSRR